VALSAGGQWGFSGEARAVFNGGGMLGFMGDNLPDKKKVAVALFHFTAPAPPTVLPYAPHLGQWPMIVNPVPGDFQRLFSRAVATLV